MPSDTERKFIDPIVWERLKSDGIDERIVDAMRKTPISEFIWEHSQLEQPSNSSKKTNESPRFYDPALALQVLQPYPKNRVLEIGTYLGCNAAVLSELGATVYTVEISPKFVTIASELLHRLGYKDVFVTNANGRFGLAKFAPYDRICFTCSVPQRIPLVEEQLAAGGRIVYAMQGQTEQKLISIDKDSSGRMQSPVDHGPTNYARIKDF